MYLFVQNNHCVTSLIPEQNSTGWCYLDNSDGNSSYCEENSNINDFIAGYYIDSNGLCVLKEELRITGLTENQWNWNMALLGHFTGFTILFLLSFLAVLVMRR